MNELSVVLIQKKEGILAGVLFLLLTLICGMIAWFCEETVGFFVAGLCALCSVGFFISTGNQQILDSEGIHIKCYFGAKHYPWELVEKTKIICISSKDLPRIQFFIRGRKSTVLIRYTKRTFACLRYYYGEPDVDYVKKPPTIT